MLILHLQKIGRYRTFIMAISESGSRRRNERVDLLIKKVTATNLLEHSEALEDLGIFLLLQVRIRVEAAPGLTVVRTVECCHNFRI